LNKKPLYLVAGSFALAMAFSAKGMSGAIPPVVAVAAQTLYARNWSFVRSFRWLLIVPLFILFISPVLYSYYVQYDLHPEKVIRGMKNISGIRFILFYQNVERLQGDNWGNAGSKDPFLFFHSLLWALLPWCIVGYWAFGKKTIGLVKERMAYKGGREILSYSTILVMFTIMSLSHFKLPHYLNILFPYFALLIAGQLKNVQSPGVQKALLRLQKVIVVLLVVAAIVVNTYFFPVTGVAVVLIALLALYLLYWEWKNPGPQWPVKLVGISLAGSLFVNVLLNGNFYQQLSTYQAGIKIAAVVKEKQIPPDKIYLYDWENYTLNYYTAYLHPVLNNAADWQQTPTGEFWVAGHMQRIKEAAAQHNLLVDSSYTFSDYRTTRLTGKFLNPVTRASVCDTVTLARIVHPTGQHK